MPVLKALAEANGVFSLVFIEAPACIAGAGRFTKFFGIPRLENLQSQATYSNFSPEYKQYQSASVRTLYKRKSQKIHLVDSSESTGESPGGMSD